LNLRGQVGQFHDLRDPRPRYLTQPRKLRRIGNQCVAALDLSCTTDLSALVLVFPDDDGGPLDVLPLFWVLEEGARKREQRDHVPYLQWIRDGFIEATPGEVVNNERPAATSSRKRVRPNLQCLAAD
jgi:phage terminase large subunit-like protein